MTKGAIGKLKCMLKKWHAKSHRHRLDDDNDKTWQRRQVHHEEDEETGGEPNVNPPQESTEKDVPSGMHPVYVGKSRRRYLIGSHLAGHPLFRVLVQRSGGVSEEEADGGGSTVVVGCEVVLFEHLLWMLENADPQPEALDELVDFYSC